ncbi:hypothetical protein F5050DRAFT_1708456 [Lentinula boryana]|uniref:Uncharacterized protein n=1 Tax=Lentinula boryana TaxID=40481 RepID=A0ABQ8QSA2_9AGAR|nr:hypothetical protein F5050DRAFT_1708456 [Lentinula boryana]
MTRSCSCASCVLLSGQIENIDNIDCVLRESTCISMKSYTRLSSLVTAKENLNNFKPDSDPLQPSLVRNVQQSGIGSIFETTSGAAHLQPVNRGDLFQDYPSCAAVTAVQQHGPSSLISWDSNVGCQDILGNVRVSHRGPRGDMPGVAGQTAVIYSETGDTILQSGFEEDLQQYKDTRAHSSSSSTQSLSYYIRKAQERIKAQRPTPHPRPEDCKRVFEKSSETACTVYGRPVKVAKGCREIVKMEWPPRAPSPSLLPDPSDVFRESGSRISDDEVKGSVVCSPILFFQSRGMPTQNRDVRSTSLKSGFRDEESAIGPKLDIMSSDLTEFLEHEHASLLRRQREWGSSWPPRVVDMPEQDTTRASFEDLECVDTITLEDIIMAERPIRRTKSLDYLEEFDMPMEVKCPRPVRASSFQSVEVSTSNVFF